MNELLEILKSLKPGVDFEGNKTLVDSQVIDSLDIITFISEITENFDVDIPYDEITPENFNSVEAMWALIERLKEE